MRRLMLLLIFVLGCVIALGFYRGWFDLTMGGSGGQRNITLSVDKDKIKADEKLAKDKLPTTGNSNTPTDPGKN